MADAPCPVPGCDRPRDHRDLTCPECEADIPSQLLAAVWAAWRVYEAARGPAVDRAWVEYRDAYIAAVASVSPEGVTGRG